MSRSLRFLPVAIVLVLIAAFVWRLANPPDSTVPSRMIGRPVPAFQLAAAVPTAPGFTSAELATGKPRLMNLFASWCVPCIAEAPVLDNLTRRGVAIDGIAIRDRADDVAAFLEKNGNPYQRIGSDPTSRVQIALGTAGVPESFVVDGRGVIRHQHIGPIQPADIPTILAELEKAR
jgi:cytochrome c biogenesis protein CcmG, thiol:disulfide interchange protein DsbE